MYVTRGTDRQKHAQILLLNFEKKFRAENGYGATVISNATSTYQCPGVTST